MQTPHERLRWAREQAGYESAADAAKAMRIREPTYYAHENGSRGLKGVAERYARFYKVSLEWLLTGRGQPHTGAHPLIARIDDLPPPEKNELLNFLAFIESRRRS